MIGSFLLIIGSQYEPTVNEVKVPVLERELCNAWLEHKELNVTDGMICAGYPEGKKDACQVSSFGICLLRVGNGKNLEIQNYEILSGEIYQTRKSNEPCAFLLKFLLSTI